MTRHKKIALLISLQLLQFEVKGLIVKCLTTYSRKMRKLILFFILILCRV